MQKFQCHKVVHAAKIVRVEGYLIDGVTLHFEDGESIAKDAAWSLKFTPGEGQYYVVYSDGYASISPAKAFEEDYHAIDDGLVSEFPVIAMGHGKIEVGNASWEGLPALFLGNDGQGLGVERQRNGAARDGETLMLITFANIQGLEAIEKAVARVREDMGYAVPAEPPIPPSTFQDRVRTERAELAEKIEKLTAFRASDRWADVHPSEQFRLRAQLGHMENYLQILDDRIAGFQPVEV